MRLKTTNIVISRLISEYIFDQTSKQTYWGNKQHNAAAIKQLINTFLQTYSLRKGKDVKSTKIELRWYNLKFWLKFRVIVNI